MFRFMKLAVLLVDFKSGKQKTDNLDIYKSLTICIQQNNRFRY